MGLRPEPVVRKIRDGLSVVAEPLGLILGHIGAGILAVMMFFTVVDVGLRYFAGRPIKGSYELTEFMMAVVIALPFAWCQLKKGHISVDVLIHRLPKRPRAALNCFTELLSLGFLGLVTWQCVRHVLQLYGSNTHSTILPIPLYPFVIGVSIGMAVFTVVVLRDFFASLYEAMGWDDGST